MGRDCDPSRLCKIGETLGENKLRVFLCCLAWSTIEARSMCACIVRLGV